MHWQGFDPGPGFGFRSLRPRLGVEIRDLNPDLGSYFDVPDGKGVLVTRVHQDTPGARAGLKAGDVILEVDGKKVEDEAELRHRLARHEKGAAGITVMRKSQRQTLTAQLGERSDPMASRQWREFRRQIRLPDRRPEMQRYERELRDLRLEMDKLRREMHELEQRQ